MWEVFEGILEEKGLTMADVVKGTGINFPTLSNWKKRRHMISPKNGKLIAEYLGISYDYLMGGEPKVSTSGKTWHFSDKTAEMAEKLTKRPDLMDLLSVAERCEPGQIRAFIGALEAMMPKQEMKVG